MSELVEFDGTELLRVARELERFGDLVTNVGERIIYLETGTLEDINIDAK